MLNGGRDVFSILLAASFFLIYTASMGLSSVKV